MHKSTCDLLYALKTAMDERREDVPWWYDVEPALEAWCKEGTPDYDPPSKRKGDCWTCEHDTAEGTSFCIGPTVIPWAEEYATEDLEGKDSPYPIKDGNHPDCPSYKERL